MRIYKNLHTVLAVLLTLLALQSCHGMFDNYDEPVTAQSVGGQLYIDASAWDKWYYIDLQDLAEKTKDDPSFDGSQLVVEENIPLTATGEQTATHPDHLPGQYMYWFDAFNEGKSNNHFEYFTPTEPQTDPENWTFAVHRTEVRTNGCGAYETLLTDIDQAKASTYYESIFSEDEWSENVVWSDSQRMLEKYVGSQGININTVLSSWLDMDIKTLPPAFTHNNHVFILKLPDGTYGALQLADYISPKTGTKCCLTIKYRYPL